MGTKPVSVRSGEKGSKEQDHGCPCLVSRERTSTRRSVRLPTSCGRAAFPASWGRVTPVYTAGPIAVHAAGLMPALAMELGAW